MKEIVTEIDIKASESAVWAVLADFSAYSEWNPSLLRVRADLVPGARVDFHFKSSRRTMRLNAEIISALPGHELRWVGPVSRFQRLLFRGEHYWLISKHPTGRGVRLVHGERFTGLLVPLMSAWLEHQVRPAYAALNQALKARAEAASINEGAA